MENNIKYINGHKINILDGASDLNDELPNEIDFSNLEQVENKELTKLIPKITQI